MESWLCLLPLDQQDRDVVLPEYLSAPPFDRLDQPVESVRKGKTSPLVQGREQPARAEVLPVRVADPGQPIRVEDQPVAGLQGDHPFVVTAAADAEGKAGDLQLRRRFAFSQMDRPRLPGRNEPELTGVEGEDTVQEGEGMARGRLGREFPAEPDGDLGRSYDGRPRTARDTGQQLTERDGQEGGGDAVTAHVQHAQPGVPVAQPEHVQVVPSELAARLERPREPGAGNLRRQGREEGTLDPGGG